MAFRNTERANKKANELMDIVDNIDKLRDRLASVEAERDDIKSIIANNQSILRKEDTNNVLNYIIDNIDLLEKADIAKYLVHCINMLNGNIDRSIQTFCFPANKE